MEMENKPLFGLAIEGNTASTISSSAQWGRILAWCGIIMGIMFIIFGILFLMSFNKASGSLSGFESGNGFAGSMAAMGGIAMAMYVVMGALVILGNIFLLNYANRTSTALKTNDLTALNSGFAGLRNYMAFWAIIMIIGLLFMLIGFAGVLSNI